MDPALMANALRNQTDDQPVLTPDGRQISQRQYRLEQQRGEQTAKLDSLRENPLASGVYGATGSDAATGLTAGLEGILYSLGSMAFARGAQGTRQMPHNSLVQEGMPTREAQKGYPGVKPAIGMNDWALEKMASEKAELQKNQQLKAKSLLERLGDAAGSEGDTMQWSKYDPRFDPDKQIRAVDLGSHMQLYEPPPKPGSEEQARKDLHKKAGFGDLGSFGVANKEQSSQMFQPADPNEYEILDNSSPEGYAAQARRQQFYMPNNNVHLHPMGEEHVRARHDTRAEDLVTSGNWARPMNSVADLIEAIRKRGKKNE